jgi:HAD superfamily hydrolase (TIGR01450 family)
MLCSSVAIILSAGIGSRLAPLTNTTPKCLIPVYDKSILDHQIYAMLESGINEFVIVVGYKREMVREHLEKFKDIKIHIIENTVYRETNNMYSLYLTFNKVEELISKKKLDTVILLNGDVVFDSTILQNMLFLEGNIIASQKDVFYEESMKITLKENGFINDIAKTITEQDAYGVSIDLYSFNIQGWNMLKNEVNRYIKDKQDLNKWTEVALKDLLNNPNSSFLPHDIKDAYWFEIDNIEDLKKSIITFKLNNEKKNILEKKLFIFDVDGTVKNGDTKVEGIDQLFYKIHQNGGKYCFLSNNTSMSKTDYIKKLSDIIGIELSKDDLYTPLDQVVRYLREKTITDIFIVGTESVKKYFSSENFRHDKETPGAVIVTFDTSLDYSKLATASRILMNPSVKFILANIDARCPTEYGFIPDAGSIAEMLKTTTEHDVDYRAGKPSTEMLQTILQTKKVSRENCVFFGDRMYTDMPMGINASILTVLVLTGETQLENLSTEDVNKYLIMKSYTELH